MKTAYLAGGITLMVALAASSAFAQTYSNTAAIYNPNWNITLTDAGYSDLLLDNTLGFQGREYLSGEWGAAVSYKVGATSVTPTWLEPQFVYPDWTTNSTFTTVNPIAVTGQNFGGLDATASSTIANRDLRIDITYQMVDTITGMKMGASPASASNGNAIDSNRYVLKQTYTVTNINPDGQAIQNLNLFQFLHSLNGVQSVYDSRTYAGPQSNYRYDTTQIAIDPTATNPDGTPTTFHDYISFGSKIAPVAFDNGWYGINDGVTDNHYLGKPSVGIHLAIENDALANLDSFAPTNPANQWVSGAQKYSLTSLALGQSASLDVLLSVRTGTIVQSNDGSDTPTTGSANGGATQVGGVDFSISKVTKSGDFYCEYSAADKNEINERIAEGEFKEPNFKIPGALQLYLLEFTGEHDGAISLIFNYDPSQLADGTNQNLLDVYHFTHGVWNPLHGTVDPFNHTITVNTDSLSPFGVGVAVPEPASIGLLLTGSAMLLMRRPRKTQIA